MKLKMLPALLGLVMTIGGVAATWSYASGAVPTPQPEYISVGTSGFIYTPEEMPDEQVTAINRLSDILNKRYTSDRILTDSWDFLMNETIQVYWNGNLNADPYVGSMDQDEKLSEAIDILFEDVLFETNVSFILKNQDLNGDGYNEVAMYSTSDDLCNKTSNYSGVVCVYVTVFTPTIDKKGNITGYWMVCESLRGYCYEIQYAPTGAGRNIASFSTDEWRKSVAYTRNYRDYEIPAADRLNFNSYHKQYRYNNRNYTTKPYGNTLSTELKGQIPYLSI
jgi:hypothetical protein